MPIEGRGGEEEDEDDKVEDEDAAAVDAAADDDDDDDVNKYEEDDEEDDDRITSAPPAAATDAGPPTLLDGIGIGSSSNAATIAGALGLLFGSPHQHASIHAFMATGVPESRVEVSPLSSVGLAPSRTALPIVSNTCV